ncbi:PAS domain-containing protein [Hymenobacter sp. BT186]|uniref:histidine kinase n=1 Tax=Hymenobacter telluris TaxID=2816474 RepID=A0A939JF62_9BACT|nr:PAS domain S-box protein [Hymenobacter telluris]MBO0361150.1 PAS domain-containing protein [Hymenobacter telluris]MBW3377178.1 PAS domain-containing protein [Hymenobacter norwichensis]
MLITTSLPDYQQVFRVLPGNHLLLTPKGKVVDCSAGFAQLAGQPLSEIAGRNSWHVWPATPNNTKPIAAVLAQVQETRQPGTLLLPNQRLTYTPVLSEGDELRYIVQSIEHLATPAPAAATVPATNQPPGAATETALHQALADADAQRARLQSLFMQAPAAIAVLHGPEHVFTLANQGYQELVGARPLLGKTIREGLPELEGQVFYNLLDQVYRTGETFYGNEMVAHLDRQNNGQSAPYYFNFIYQAIRDAAGAVEGVLVFAFDMTESVLSRKQVEQSENELQHANEELATLNEELQTANEEFHASNSELLSTQDQLKALNLELEERVRRRTRAQDLAQQEVERQRLRLERFFMQVPAAICVFDGPDFVFELTNPAYQQMFPGRPMLGKPLLEVMPTIKDYPAWRTLQEVYATGVTHEEKSIPIPIARTEGGPLEEAYFNYTQQARFDAQGKIDGVLVFAYEVTDQVRARQREQQTARAFETMTNAIPHQVWTSTARGDMDYYNQQWYAYTGSTFEQASGQGWQQFCHPDDLPRQQTQWAEAVREGRPYQVEARLRSQQGNYRWFLIRAQPFRNEQGKITKWFGANTDIHEQKHLEQKLVESEQYFRLMADRAPVMIWVTGPDGHCLYLNQQWYDYTGQQEAEALGFGWTNAIHPAEAEQAGAAFRDANARRVPYNMVFRLKTKQGTYRWVVDAGLPKFDSNGEFEGFVGSVVDIHERKMAEQALRLASQKLATTNKELRAANQQSQQANADLAETNEQLTRINQDLDNFVYTASHDLRQPVNNLAGVFEELKRSATFHDPEAEQLIEMFEGALHQIHSTIQGLAEVVHVERRNEQFTPEAVELLPLTNGVIQSIQSQATALQAEFQLDFSAVPTICFARLNLQSILYNLLSNALKYAHPDRPPVVRVATELLPDGSPVLLVQDNGLGLDLARYGNDLFKMFRRFHDHVTGSGMGLYLVNRIVQQAGGRIEVDSTLGVGTTFRIYPREQQRNEVVE